MIDGINLKCVRFNFELDLNGCDFGFLLVRQVKKIYIKRQKIICLNVSRDLKKEISFDSVYIVDEDWDFEMLKVWRNVEK